MSPYNPVPGLPVQVCIKHGGDVVMHLSTDNNIKDENVPKAARLLMDTLYLRLDDQVSVAKFRAHRLRLRAKHREQAVGQAVEG